MEKFIKTVASIALCAVLVFGLPSCNKRELSDYDVGYSDGYDEGFVEGQQELGGYASYSFDDVCSEHDIDAALAILILYADGESFSEEEIFSAIQTVTSFYDDVCEVIHDVEYYYD